MKINLGIILSIVMLTSSSAQEYAFKVLVNKGQNEVKAGNDWQPVKVGSSLKSIDELKVSPNAYLGLVHVTGRPLEVKEAGKYKVADLSAKVNGGSSVLNKYTDFILSTNSSKGNKLEATGAVHRGLHDVTVLLPTVQPVVYNDNIRIEWLKDAEAQGYTVKFNSLFGDELETIQTQDTSVSVNLNGSKFKNEDNIIVQVFTKGEKNKKSDEFTVKKLSKADKARIKTLLNEISSQTQENTALNKLILAGFYEQNSLVIDAATAYQEAIKLAPDVTAYRDAYQEFLKRKMQ